MATITVNGKTYDRVDDMPPEIRQAYDQAMGLLADKNQNGIPDIAEGLLPGAKPTVTTRFKITTKKKIVYKGQTYESPDDLPAEARQAYQRAMGTLGPHPDGLPDAPESGQAAALPSPASIVATPPMIPAVPGQ